MQLRILVEKSRAVLKPLGDPLEVDFGLHRWLDYEREEAYSDWLEWVVQQAQTPERVFRLFGLGKPPPEIRVSSCTTDRELCVPEGHEGRRGRLDLVVWFGHEAIIVVEVKTGCAEEAVTSKQAGYLNWLKAEGCSKSHPIFLATSAAEDTCDGFVFRSWAHLCIEMRCLAIEFYQEGRFTAAALILAFVGAIEQNLLGFSASLVRQVCRKAVTFFDPKIVTHLEQFLRRLES